MSVDKLPFMLKIKDDDPIPIYVDKHLDKDHVLTSWKGKKENLKAVIVAENVSEKFIQLRREQRLDNILHLKDTTLFT